MAVQYSPGSGLRPFPFVAEIYNIASLLSRLFYEQVKRVPGYFPSDGLSRVYVTRCLDFLVNPPPADWDGVYEFKTK
jgi:hypothetical protein